MGSMAQLSQIPHSMWSQIPVGKPPPGQMPNLQSPVDAAPGLIAGASVLLAIMLFFYGIRAYSKLFIIKKAQWDDASVTVGLLGTIVLYVAFVVGCGSGPFGKHFWDVSLAEIDDKNFLLTNYIWITVVNIPLGAVKLTFFLMYLQMFWPMKWLRICVYIGASLTAAFYVAVTVAQFVLATPPRSKTWFEWELSPDFQQHSKILAIPISSVGLGIDIVLLVLPVRCVMMLQLPTRKKIGLVLIFLTGILAVVGSILSLYFRHVDTSSTDSTWNAVNVEIMTLLELTIGITCASLPSLSKLLRHHSSLLHAWSSRISSKLSLLRSTRSRTTEHPTEAKNIDASGTSSSDHSREMVGAVPNGPRDDGRKDLEMGAGGFGPRVEEDKVWLRDVQRGW